MMRSRLRHCWLKLHRWVGLTFGCVLVLTAITGSLLVVARPLDAAMHPELFRSGGDPRGSLQPVVSRLRGAFGPEAAFNIRMPTRAGESLQVTVSGAWSGTVYLDGVSARELGRREIGQGFFNALFELHTNLYAGDCGRAILAWAALVYCVLLLSGLVLWWPVGWDCAFSVRARLGRAVALLDLHRVAGAALGLFVLISVVTGAYMAWRPLAEWVNYLSGGSSATMPTPKPRLAPGTVPAGVDAAVQRAREHWPHAIVSIVHVPPRSLAAARIRLRLPDDPHPIGMSTVWPHPLSGGVLAARHWSELGAGSRAFSVIYPLHSGGLYGFPTLLATFMGGIALAGFGFSGIWLWWQRRYAKPLRSTSQK